MGEGQEISKAALRRRLRCARRALDARDRARLSAAACSRLLAIQVVRDAKHLVAYAASDGEVDPGGAVDAWHRAGRRIYYPRLSEDGRVAFLATRPEELETGAHGIPEPPVGLPRLEPDGAEQGVILVPGVAFDARGQRLGRGQGCYDRALAEYAGAVRVGVAYDFQIIPAAPVEPWDLGMHVVVTDRRVIWGAPRPAGGLPKESPT